MAFPLWILHFCIFIATQFSMFIPTLETWKWNETDPNKRRQITFHVTLHYVTWQALFLGLCQWCHGTNPFGMKPFVLCSRTCACRSCSLTAVWLPALWLAALSLSSSSSLSGPAPACGAESLSALFSTAESAAAGPDDSRFWRRHLSRTWHANRTWGQWHVNNNNKNNSHLAGGLTWTSIVQKGGSS